LEGFVRARVLIAIWVSFFSFYGQEIQAKGRGFNKQSIDQLNVVWSDFLATHVDGSGLVNYQTGKDSIDVLRKYIGGFKDLEIEHASDNIKMAAYINLYNASMIYHLLNYVEERGMKIESKEFLNLKIDDLPQNSDIFEEPQVEVSGVKLSLNEIEHQLLRRENLSSDHKKLAVSTVNPLIHMALNCGAISCPKISKVAVTDKNLPSVLEQAARDFLSNNLHVQMINNHKMQLNKILLWYYSDFDSFAKKKLGQKGAGDYLASLINEDAKDSKIKKQHLKRYFNSRSALYLHNPFNASFKFYYNWSVNDRRNHPQIEMTDGSTVNKIVLKKQLKDKIKKITGMWQKILDRHLSKDGLVNYQTLYKEKGKLDEFISEYRGLNLQLANDQQKLSVLINFYNAAMISSVFKYCEDIGVDIHSDNFAKLQINELKGIDDIWESYHYSLSGITVTLNNIEHQLIRRQPSDNPEIDQIFDTLRVSYLDPRIHAAVNCAAVSCPNILSTAFTPENVDENLGFAMESFINNEYQFKKKNTKTLQVNEIVRWYYQDFDTVPKSWPKSKFKGAGDYLASFVKKSSKDSGWKKEHLQKKFNSRSQVYIYDPLFQNDFTFFYDWRVNDVRNRKLRTGNL